jgi:N-acetylneuraminic acid mutarotase
MTALVAALSLTLAVAPPSADKLPPLPVKVSSFGACDGWLYVYGGHTGTTHQYSTATVTGRFFRAPLSGGEWEELPQGPALQGLALVAQGGKAYRVGGMQSRNKPRDAADNHSVAGSACYDPKSRKWAALPDLPAGRSSHEAVVAGDKLYVVGGWDMRGAKGTTWHGTALVLDLAKPDRWQSIEQPFRRRALGAAAAGGKVCVIGGLEEEGATCQVDIYDPKTGKWSRGPEFPGGSGNGLSPAACAIGEALYASGPDGKVHRLEAGRWRHVGTQEVKRFVHRLVPGAEGSLLVVGG